MKKMLRMLVASVVATVFLAGTSFALDYDFSGTFKKDNDVLRFDFTIGTARTVTFFTSSWKYVGSAPTMSGFDPDLTLWSSTGKYITDQDDGGKTGSTQSNGVSYSYGQWDTFFTPFLNPGDYFVTIAQYDNDPYAQGQPSLYTYADGFQEDGNPNFTFDMGWGSQPMFNGLGLSGADPRTGAWEFHMLNVDKAALVEPVPEPATIVLLAAGLFGLGLARKRFRA